MASLETPTPSDYEKCREQRIKENLERMQKLGIHDLSLKMKSIKPNRYRKNNKPLPADHSKTPDSPLPASVPTRRSSRLQTTPAVCYSELDLPKKGKDVDDLLTAKNPKPEVYTEEHEKLLGEAKTEWTLFVDGYGKDGKRIYDQVRGKTCHQCRQKTLGHRTHCIKCSMVQGQFCGDCLYMRYGENVLEAMQNPDWICPVCRGICNCSLCRQAKGWAPTGMLYRKISSQGYKSVAHYLIQTRRSNPNLETQVCAKMSVPFSIETIESKAKNFESEVNTEFQTSDKYIINDVKLESDQRLKEKNSQEEVNGGENEKSELANVENKVNNEVKPVSVTPETKTGSQKKHCAILIEGRFAVEYGSNQSEVNTDEIVSELQSSDKSIINNVKQESDQGLKEKTSEAHVNEVENEKSELTNVENKVNKTDDEVNPVTVTLETKTGSRKKRCAIAIEGSIAGRLRSRRARA